MMYSPKHFDVQDNELVLQLIEDFPLASVVSCDEEGDPFINHIPMIAEKRGDTVILYGHMARRNPQWRHFIEGSSATVIFHGPHAYITPTWYVSGRDVPTWNYAVVHLKGTMELVEDFESLCELLEKLTKKFESGRVHAWEFELPEDLADSHALTQAIVGFKMRADRVEAKFKLSQNRSESDRIGVIEGLAGQGDEMSRKIRDLMAKLSPIRT